ncbi:MAG TPA: preprotein translocase subunit SecG [Candidatus Desulfofervidus auxilii]|uniref:Protein-export membrane protein SecG n=1 Tax=Desulfofervidus auxilii TaxID=1621989 RepID=A0A7C1ZLS2_DESA2|nr:MAG: Protein-export membrane protein SecG [Candidatus Methanoperedenaceae archaeon GB50]CAD7777740.1 MAG: Protein-export membrane protein SecG [Candidatus Methanoperedenaceae archaeon GB37]CAD7781479.1 Protein-export membrane protein SecG [Candidatus Methanoperedenaceae archaeon GB50]CAD7782361.1 Protein-export membrane protein SecG [Candidatus Methanoperedenaceae archaeon GB37]HEC67745.1 preprotein translocase subunit SecG [Candidatus Desulfofervidus auxilii]
MFTFMVILHVIICLALIFIILLQRGRGAEMGAAFGGASQTLFGPGGSLNLLNKVTTVLAILFFLTSISLTYMASHKKVETEIKKAPVTTTEKQIPQNTKQSPLPKGLTEKNKSDKK